MFEPQLAQFATTTPAYNFENISRQPEISFENVNAVITRDGNSTRDLPYPNHARKAKKHGVQPRTLGFELAWGRMPTR